ncbi:MAG: hypothetical protein AAB425_04750, partial [Bdellovibrionota bacterium]
ISSAQSLAGKGLVQNLPRKNAFYVQLSENRDCTEAQAHGRALLTSPDADPKQAIQSLLDDGVLQDEAFGHTVIADPHVRPDTLEALFHHWSKAGENAAAKILLDETIARLAKTPEYPMAKLIPLFADRASSQKQPFPGELAALDEAMKLRPLLSSEDARSLLVRASELANQDPEGAAQIKTTLNTQATTSPAVSAFFLGGRCEAGEVSDALSQKLRTLVSLAKQPKLSQENLDVLHELLWRCGTRPELASLLQTLLVHPSEDARRISELITVAEIQQILQEPYRLETLLLSRKNPETDRIVIERLMRKPWKGQLAAPEQEAASGYWIKMLNGERVPADKLAGVTKYLSNQWGELTESTRSKLRTALAVAIRKKCIGSNKYDAVRLVQELRNEIGFSGIMNLAPALRPVEILGAPGGADAFAYDYLFALATAQSLVPMPTPSGSPRPSTSPVPLDPTLILDPALALPLIMQSAPWNLKMWEQFAKYLKSLAPRSSEKVIGLLRQVLAAPVCAGGCDWTQWINAYQGASRIWRTNGKPASSSEGLMIQEFITGIRKGGLSDNDVLTNINRLWPTLIEPSLRAPALRWLESWIAQATVSGANLADTVCALSTIPGAGAVWRNAWSNFGNDHGTRAKQADCIAKSWSLNARTDFEPYAALIDQSDPANQDIARALYAHLSKLYPSPATLTRLMPRTAGAAASRSAATPQPVPTGSGLPANPVQDQRLLEIAVRSKTNTPATRRQALGTLIAGSKNYLDSLGAVRRILTEPSLQDINPICSVAESRLPFERSSELILATLAVRTLTAGEKTCAENWLISNIQFAMKSEPDFTVWESLFTKIVPDDDPTSRVRVIVQGGFRAMDQHQ